MTALLFRLAVLLGLILTAAGGCTKVVLDAARSSTASFLTTLVSGAVDAAFDQ